MADSEQALVRRIQSGDTDAFAELVTGHHRSVYGIALSVTGDTDEAEDMTQSCFVDAFARIGELRDGRRFSSWLYAIARNRCRDWLRDRRRRPVLLSDPEQLGVADLPELPQEPEARVLAESRRDEVRAVVRGLPPEYRSVVALRYVAELSFDEIADALGVSASAARVRCHRARRMLEDRLEALERIGQEDGTQKLQAN